MTSDPEDVGSGTSLTARSPELDFSLVLSRVIGSVKDDPAQLRNAVYELARFKLQREAWHRHPPMSFIEICRMMRAFESAIARVETVSAKHDEIKALQSLDRLIESWESSASTMLMAPQAPMLVIDQTAGATADVEPVPAMPALPRRASPKHASSKHASPNHFRGWQWPGAAQLVRGVVVMVVAAALCVVLDRQFGLLGRHGAPATAPVPATPTSKTADARLPAAPSVATAPALPLPDVYGVYALNNGRLHELEALPGRVPDPKVFMSTPIKTASRTVLSDGQVAFIAYRRDIAGNAPDRVAVRIIARVVRAMTFNTTGQASTASVDDQWTIRSNAYEWRVAPVNDHAEMLMIRPENPDFSLPPGRYGMVLKGQAYDFTIDGPITDPAQCLERIEAANGAFYSECRHP
jgi:hypothetical protein